MNLRVSVCITTHNRCPDLVRTLEALAALDPQPDEILVVADGCSDETAAVVRSSWPGVRLIEHAAALGSIPSRNELAKAAQGDILLSLDDDSYPLGKDFIARLRAVFTARPKVAVVSCAQRTDEFPNSLTAQDLGPSTFTGSYANSAAAIRRRVFLELGGYPAFFQHAYEEPDFALRCLAAGWQVWHESSLHIRHHYTSAQRNEMRTHHRHSRNELWSVMLRCPLPQLVAVTLFRIARQAGYAMHRGPAWLLQEPKWWYAMIKGLPRCWRDRTPIAWPTYLDWMRLVRSPIADEPLWEARFGDSVPKVEPPPRAQASHP